MRYPLLAQAKLPPRENQPPQPVPERVGEPSVFQHVIYIIKENRTYDQVLGDVRDGQRRRGLVHFGERVTPNQHKLVRDFALLDNTYCCGILSADGHQWADSAHGDRLSGALFAGWPRSYPGGGDGARRRMRWLIRRRASSGTTRWRTAKPSATSANSPPTQNAGKIPRARASRISSTATAISSSGANEIAYACEPDIEALRPYVMTNTIGWDLDVPDVFRAAQFIKT